MRLICVAMSQIPSFIANLATVGYFQTFVTCILAWPCNHIHVHTFKVSAISSSLKRKCTLNGSCKWKYSHWTEAANGNVVIEQKLQNPYMVKHSQWSSCCESLHSQLVVLSTTASFQRGYNMISSSVLGLLSLLLCNVYMNKHDKAT